MKTRAPVSRWLNPSGSGLMVFTATGHQGDKRSHSYACVFVCETVHS